MKKLRRQRKIQPAQTGKNNVSPQPAVSPKKHNSPTAQQELNAVIPYDENLLERSRTQWQFGDWPSLAQLNRDTLQHHPDRAKLALLAAAGRLQTGQNAEARQFVRLAQDWGVSKKLISQILIAGVHNSLGRAEAIGNRQQQALQHFEKAITIGAPGGAAALVANARAIHELDSLGLLPGSQGSLQRVHALAKLGAMTEKKGAPLLRPIGPAYSFYKHLGTLDDQKPVPFLLIDSKSLPRSGLHYLKNTLSKVFGEHFSFCEWYQETGCCKQTPCALTGFAEHAQKTSQLRIRLIKSHDFKLTDPILETNSYLRRIILIRDPLYILTSWFTLTQLEAQKEFLKNNGININKILLAHEKEVLTPAYRLLNDHFTPPSIEQLTSWLEMKMQYMAGFTKKWVKPITEQPEKFTKIVRYENINEYIESLVHQYSAYMSKDMKKRSLNAISQANKQFVERKDPFSVPSETVSEYLQQNSILFIKIATNLNKNSNMEYS